MEPSGANAALRAQQTREGQHVDTKQAGGMCHQGAAIHGRASAPFRSLAAPSNLHSNSQPLHQERSAAAHAPADGPLPGPRDPSHPQLPPPCGPAAGCGQSRLWRARAAQQSAADGPSTAEMLRRRRRQRQLALWKASSFCPLSSLFQGQGRSVSCEARGCLMQA